MTQKTRYSDTIPGAPGNYGWAVRFDKTTPGYIGINQLLDNETVRVLLSPRQFKALVAFNAGLRLNP